MRSSMFPKIQKSEHLVPLEKDSNTSKYTLNKKSKKCKVIVGKSSYVYERFVVDCFDFIVNSSRNRILGRPSYSLLTTAMPWS